MKNNRSQSSKPELVKQLTYDNEEEVDEKDKSMLDKLTDYLPQGLFS